jgi:hypothetical protein
MYLSDSLIDRISEEQFLDAYNKYPPNKWTKFSFRYFSTNTVEKDLWVKHIFQYTTIGLFLLGFLFVVLNLSRIFVAIPTFAFVAILVAIGIIMGGGAIMNNLRIRKIRKILGVSKTEYELLCMYYL